ncbi:hypothetical protein BCR43DRAFT_489822 [Syncephalastrum racemosum]|uniref:Uncharacterized protein n=1 Tax=Syncephalastrum racemosum TaxID=13706 RepID=A0A1X2HEX4_SYNRA|nr:hypothetical protein BCR43DRAFT_489822 [Syncephalastrum racemosum]
MEAGATDTVTLRETITPHVRSSLAPEAAWIAAEFHGKKRELGSAGYGVVTDEKAIRRKGAELASRKRVSPYALLFVVA